MAQRITPAHVLAAVGIPFLIWEGWTVVAWLADGPYQITQFRDRDSASWYAARVFEGLVIVVSIAVLVYVVRGCLRARRLLTFDVMFCLCAGTVVNGDIPNLIQPTFMNSSNWVNLNAMCGHMPFVVNPDCGRAPDPILFTGLLSLFGYLGLALVATAAVRWGRRRWPRTSTAKLVTLVLLGGVALDLVLEPAVMIPLRLWSWAPMPFSVHLGGGFRYPWIEALAGGLAFGMFVAVYAFRDDHGRTLVERGLDRHSPRARKAISMLALYGFFQLGLWGVANMPMIALGFYQQQWPNLPAHIVNDLCDAPGIQNTRYGPCPGSPGYRMPGRTSNGE